MEKIKKIVGVFFRKIYLFFYQRLKVIFISKLHAFKFKILVIIRTGTAWPLSIKKSLSLVIFFIELMMLRGIGINGIYSNQAWRSSYMSAIDYLLYLTGSLLPTQSVYCRCGFVPIFKIETINFRPKFRYNFIDKLELIRLSLFK